MSLSFDVLWLNASSSLKGFDQPLLRYLSQHLTVAQWEYSQSDDEASSLETAVMLLHDFLQYHPPVHLAGHGLSGVLGLTYARRFPEQVRSLTLLSVAAQPAITWQTHYYVQRQLIACSRQQLLACIVRSLFGQQLPHSLPFGIKDLIRLLARDLEASPSPHSLFKLARLPKGGVPMPLMVCGSKTDPIVHPPALQEWLECFKSDDTLWQCPDGRHFFHYFYPQLVGEQLLQFWRCLSAQQFPVRSLMTAQHPVMPDL